MSEGAGRLIAEIIYTLYVAWSILDILIYMYVYLHLY